MVLGVDGLSSGGIEMLGEGLAQDVLQVSGLQHDLEHEELQRDADTINLLRKTVLRIRIRWIRKILASGSAKICGSTDPDSRGKISIKNCKKKILLSTPI